MTTSTTTIGVKELATKLGTDGRTLRAFLRSRGIGVGSGKRYAWPSFSDPTVKDIMREWRKANVAPAKPKASPTDATEAAA